jgi:polyhydroxybutyrate depolymerase
MIRNFFLLSLLLSLSLQVNSQTALSKSFIFEGISRTYRVYIPAVYNGSASVPLVLNLHGYGSNSTEQEIYGDFRPIADTANFIIAHPDGTLDGSNNQNWNCFNLTSINDLGFLSALIDTISATYNIDANAVYSTGMSNGGFMSYDLACGLSSRITAIASVTGDMTYAHKNSCSPSRPVPVMEIHGTSDGNVPYNGNGAFLPIDTLVKFWVKKNNCSSTPAFTGIPDINTSDGCTAEHYLYSGGTFGSSVEHYKILAGGHTWPGANFNIGVTNQDFSASKVIWNFFRKYRLDQLTKVREIEEDMIRFYPNPVVDFANINLNGFKCKKISVYDMLGRERIIPFSPDKNELHLIIASWPKGVYLFVLQNDDRIICKKLIKE